MNQKTSWKVFIVGIVLLLFVGGCVTPDAQEDQEGGSETTEDEDIVLTYWDNKTSTGRSDQMDALVERFENEYPHITVERTAIQGEELRSIIRPALTSGEGPDVFYSTPGPGNTGVLANAGLLLDLNPYADQYDWHNKYPEWIMEQGTYDGTLHSVGSEVEFIGVYYNKSIFEELGVDVPQTYDEFLNINQAALEADITPIVFGNRDQWPGFHLESAFYTAFAGQEKMQEVLNKEAGYDRPEFAEGLDAFQQLIENGYFNNNINSLSYDDQNREFFSGNAAMLITGTWMVGDMIDNMGEDVGLFMLPTGDPGLTQTAPGGIGETMMVSNDTAHPDEAAQFIDFIFSEETADLWYEGSIIPPVDVDVEQFDLDPLFMEVVEIANNPEGLSYNLDVVMPQQVNVVTQNLIQELVDGRVTGQEVVEAKQEALEEEIEAGNF